MTREELILHLRHNMLRDKAKPPLWSDDEIILRLDEAQDQFARRTHCLQTEEADFCTLTTEVGVSRYTLDPRIVYVVDVTNANNIPLRNTQRSRAPRSTSGTPTHYSTDAKGGQVRLWPTPDAVVELTMLVAHKPMSKLTQDTSEPEIDEDFHLALCEWAAYKLLRDNDVDGANIVESEKFLVSWEASVREGKRAAMRFRSTSPRQLNNWTGK